MYSTTINQNQIAWETASAYLIKLPGTQYKFWFPKSLTQIANKKIRIVFPEDFEFNIFKNGSGKYNKNKKIEEKVIGFEDILEAFNIPYDTGEFDVLEDLKDD